MWELLFPAGDHATPRRETLPIVASSLALGPLGALALAYAVESQSLLSGIYGALVLLMGVVLGSRTLPPVHWLRGFLHYHSFMTCAIALHGAAFMVFFRGSPLLCAAAGLFTLPLLLAVAFQAQWAAWYGAVYCFAFVVFFGAIAYLEQDVQWLYYTLLYGAGMVAAARGKLFVERRLYWSDGSPFPAARSRPENE
jgi:hypothetical protein